MPRLPGDKDRKSRQKPLRQQACKATTKAGLPCGSFARYGGYCKGHAARTDSGTTAATRGPEFHGVKVIAAVKRTRRGLD